MSYYPVAQGGQAIYAPPGSTIIEQQAVVVIPKRTWASGCGDCCADCNTCCYVTWCGCCAMGDVAEAGGRSRCMSCCIVPAFLPCCLPGCLAQDREALAARLGIQDDWGCLFTCLCIYFFPIAGHCFLCQEVRELKAAGWYTDPAGFAQRFQQVQVPVAQPVMVAPQQAMYVAPQPAVIIQTNNGYNNYA